MPITTYGHVSSPGPLSDFDLLVRRYGAEDRRGKVVKETTTAGGKRQEWWEDFNEKCGV